MAIVTADTTKAKVRVFIGAILFRLRSLRNAELRRTSPDPPAFARSRVSSYGGQAAAQPYPTYPANPADQT